RWRTSLMSSSRFLVGIAVAISLLVVNVSLAQLGQAVQGALQQPQPPPQPPPQNNNSGNPAPPPPPTPVRVVPLSGDPVPPSQLSDSLKQSATPDPGQIDAAVASVCTMMADDTHPATQSACRDWLVLGLSDSTGTADAASFLQIYAQSINNHLLNLVKSPNASVRLKILAGIVAARVGDASLNAETMDLASQLMQDPSPAVVLEGIKAAAPVVPAAMGSPLFAAKATPFAKEIERAALRNCQGPLEASIVDSAYTALEPLFNYGRRVPNLPQMISQTLLPVTLDMLNQRLQMYRKGPVAGAPQDAEAFVELFDSQLWGVGGSPPLISGPTQIQVLQAYSDLVGVTADWAMSPAPQAEPYHDDMIDSLKFLGQIMRTFADPQTGPQPDGNLFSAGDEMSGLGTASANSQISEAQTLMWNDLSAFAKNKGAADGINPAPLVDAVGQ
ncbi:MAG TPA: hypothetical protein VMD30_07405, partial [Tepidisphaeraceae bacterium]|nr:hypothetical protein [Tepidisphaeraceae bacterium]